MSERHTGQQIGLAYLPAPTIEPTHLRVQILDLFGPQMRQDFVFEIRQFHDFFERDMRAKHQVDARLRLGRIPRRQQFLHTRQKVFVFAVRPIEALVAFAVKRGGGNKNAIHACRQQCRDVDSIQQNAVAKKGDVGADRFRFADTLDNLGIDQRFANQRSKIDMPIRGLRNQCRII